VGGKLGEAATKEGQGNNLSERLLIKPVIKFKNFNSIYLTNKI
jgi:hypothetical protein